LSDAQCHLPGRPECNLVSPADQPASARKAEKGKRRRYMGYSLSFCKAFDSEICARRRLSNRTASASCPRISKPQRRQSSQRTAPLSEREGVQRRRETSPPSPYPQFRYGTYSEEVHACPVPEISAMLNRAQAFLMSHRWLDTQQQGLIYSREMEQHTVCVQK
jgi:hypothetical protein